MSEPIPHPDKLVARLLGAITLLVLVGMLTTYHPQGGTATLGAVLLTLVLTWFTILCFVYRTRWWN